MGRWTGRTIPAANNFTSPQAVRMAIQVPCPRCKHVTHLPDSAGGKLGRCKHCNAIVRIPLPPSQRKYCCVCRTDVSLSRRVKDDDGRYYCATCWKARQDATAATGDDFWNALGDLEQK
jgi:hypothetical protein